MTSGVAFLIVENKALAGGVPLVVTKVCGSRMEAEAYCRDHGVSAFVLAAQDITVNVDPPVKEKAQDTMANDGFLSARRVK